MQLTVNNPIIRLDGSQRRACTPLHSPVPVCVALCVLFSPDNFTILSSLLSLYTEQAPTFLLCCFLTRTIINVTLTFFLINLINKNI